MTMMFESVEQAKEVVASMAGADPETFVEVEGLQVGGMELRLLDDSSTSEQTKQRIRDRLAAQKGFKFKNKEGKEYKVVIGPFRDGFDCWVVRKNGMALRI